ncbi:MAG: FkbM family methyltransferase [Gemmatimonadales bacterium]|nr:FkbM family methyltransferase [Gemmatimonadales bacterium]
MSFRKSLNGAVARWGLVIEKSTPEVLQTKSRLDLDFDFLVRHEIYRNNGEFCFIQIGANDGKSREDDLGEYIKEFSAIGIMVEPQFDVFSQLQDNFSAHPEISLINKAVHRDKKEVSLYRFDPEILQERKDLPLWATTNGIASFSRQHVVDHARKLGLGTDVVQSQSVECVSIDEILDQSSRTPDLLKIDAEGYDFEILDALNLNQFRPAIIRFENLHMSTGEYEKIIQKLIGAGYRFLANRMDTTAYLRA